MSMPTKYSEELKVWATKATTGMTLRGVQNKTGISYSTVDHILKGRIPEAGILIVFVRKLGGDVVKMLRSVGYDDIADIIEEQGAEHREPADEDLPPELQRIHGFQGEVYNELPPGKSRDRYIEKLRADALMWREMVVNRIEEEEGNPDEQ